MAIPIPSKTRLQIRQAIGYNLGERKLIVGTWSISGTTTTAKDAVELSQGGADEYIGSQVLFNEVTGAGYGLTRYVTDSDVSGVITYPTISSASAVSGAPALGEDYELWKSPLTVQELNAKIANAEVEMMGLVFMDKEDHTVWTESERYQYSFPTGFSHLSQVEYCYSKENEEQIDDCDTAWTTGAANVSASVETTIYKEGSGSAKIAVAAAAVTGNLAAYTIDSMDLTDKTEVEAWVYSTTALSAGDLLLMLDDTAACASPVESLSIPATSSYTWTRHIMSLANPVSDSAIISVGLKMAVDKGAFTAYLDDIRAVDANSRVWKVLHRDYWDVIHGATPYLKLTVAGLSTAGENRALRLTGYRQFTQVSGDAATSEIDPDFITNRVSQWLTSGDKSREFKQAAELAKARSITSWRPGTMEL